ncbi:hypothetical protein FBUS_06409 [Fasciolopsis buskii]|uniref:Uncharacterized protein n=1 Tax=Fasciolopsis buskii TaxID=27845 RepID=A0A8E0S235_9TREM|nr:hypothetical protein FBUS_06409 [Fasciolopsis buski]
MNITHLWNSPVKPASTPTPTTSEAFTTVNTESLISPIASQSELRTSDLDDSESEENTDSSALRFSDDLKKHLQRHSSNCPVEDLIREMIHPKPSLAIVPFDPAMVPPTFRREDSSAEDPDKMSPKNTAPSASMDVESISSTASRSV